MEVWRDFSQPWTKRPWLLLFVSPLKMIKFILGLIYIINVWKAVRHGTKLQKNQSLALCSDKFGSALDGGDWNIEIPVKSYHHSHSSQGLSFCHFPEGPFFSKASGVGAQPGPCYLGQRFSSLKLFRSLKAGWLLIALPRIVMWRGCMYLQPLEKAWVGT
jgi:hypothetical protein